MQWIILQLVELAYRELKALSLHTSKCSLCYQLLASLILSHELHVPTAQHI